MATNKEALVRRYLGAYAGGDRTTLEAAFADGFRFTSPYDDAIDRTAYFERCWPNHTRVASMQIERVIEQGDDVFVTYRLTMRDGRSFRNAEVLVFDRDRIATVDVYFGAGRNAKGEFDAMKPQT
jgi:ketosteroid isomerase-like protein